MRAFSTADPGRDGLRIMQRQDERSSTLTLAFSDNVLVHILQRAGSSTLGDARFATVLTRSDISEASSAEDWELSKQSSITLTNSDSPQKVAIDVRRLRKILDTAGITAGSTR